MESLYSWLPSTIPVRGFENHSLKSLWEENTDGMRKCIRDHSSIKLFWSGVPVKSSLRWLLKASNVCHRWLLKFLMFCACKKLAPPKYYSPSKLWHTYVHVHLYIIVSHKNCTVLHKIANMDLQLMRNTKHNFKKSLWNLYAESVQGP